MCRFSVGAYLIAILLTVPCNTMSVEGDNLTTVIDSASSAPNAMTASTSAGSSTTTVATAVSPTETTNNLSTSSTEHPTVPPANIPSALPICNELSVLENIDLDRISGKWYEFARKGYGTFIQNLQCLQMDITYSKGSVLVYQTYATELSDLDNQTTYKYVVQYKTQNTSDYVITSTNYDYLPIPVYKILETDYDTYLIVCSYIMEWQHSAAAFVYFRDRDTPDSQVYKAVNEAAAKYGDFQNLNLEYQGERCNKASHLVTSYVLTALLTICVWLFYI